MFRVSFFAILLLTGITAFSQKSVITVKEAERIERVLASDEMRGRKIFTPEIDKAADFIASEFKAAGLKTHDGGDSYLQQFAMVSTEPVSTNATLNGAAIEAKNVVLVSSQESLKIDHKSGYEVATISEGANLFQEAFGFAGEKKNMIVFVNESFAKNFPRLSFFRRNIFKSPHNLVFVLSSTVPSEFSIEAKQSLKEQKLANVVGILPGKSKKNEYVIFSGHYDHVGVGKPVNGDSIYNGANDDAAGITAVILLAKHFAAEKNNERTLVFAAFTAEEAGGFGSRYFSEQFDPEQVVAMFNIEMIGTESKWGKNSAYITGYEYTNMGEILQKDLQGTGFTFHPDPYTDQNLFYRSDNATLASLGVPAHTISTAKMDQEPHYHKVTDHVETLDLENMTMIIKSIALSSKSIVSGKATPTRVKADDLK